MTLRFGWLPTPSPPPEIGLVERDERLFVVEQREGWVRVVGVVRFVASDRRLGEAVERYIGKGSSSDAST